MKTKFIALVVMCLFSAALCFAGGRAQSGSSASGPVTVSLITWRGDDKAAYDEIIAKFEAKYPNIKANFEYNSDTDTVIKTRLLANDVDIYAVQAPGNYDYIKSGYALDLTGKAFLDNFIPEALEPNTLNGKVYGACQATSLVVVFYNVDIFKANNLTPPKSWNEFIAICEALKAKNIAPIAIGASNNYISQNIATPLIVSLSPDEAPEILAKTFDNPALWNQEPFVTVHNSMRELQTKNLFAPGYQGVDKFGAAALFAQGQAAMCIEGTWRAATLEQTPELNWDVFVLTAPGKQNNTYVNHPNQSHLIAPNSRHLDETLLLYEFMSSPESIKTYAQMTNQIPVGKGVTFDSPVIQKLLKSMEGKRGVNDPAFGQIKNEYMGAITDMWQKVIFGDDIAGAARYLQGQIPAMK
jgi:raffinose/stachyose/melibiose transport system substrate-binding protein